MYIITNCTGPTPRIGDIKARNYWDEAVTVAVEMAMEQLGQTNDDDEQTVREELENNSNYFDPHGEWSVCIGILSDE